MSENTPMGDVIKTEWDDELQVGYVQFAAPTGRILTWEATPALHVDLCDCKPIGIEVLIGSADTLQANALYALAMWVRR